jgi:hypothetical protein
MVLKNPATFIKTAKYLPCAGNKCSWVPNINIYDKYNKMLTVEYHGYLWCSL